MGFEHSTYEDCCGMGPIGGTQKDWTVYCPQHEREKLEREIKELEERIKVIRERLASAELRSYP